MEFISVQFAEILLAVLGLAIGSFLNVVIYRVPRRASVVGPSSRCPECGAAIRFCDNIPVISYVLLRGKCRDCSARISLRYPAIELLTGALFLTLTLKDGFRPALVPDLVFASAIVALIFIDAEHKILPNAIIYPMFPVSLAARAVWTDDFALLRVVLPAEVSDGAALAAVLAIVALGGVLMFVLEWTDWWIVGRRLEGANNLEDAEATSSGRKVFLISAGFGVVLAIGLFGGLHRGMLHLLQTFDGTVSALSGAIISGGIFWLLRLVYFAAKRKEGMGLGDAKMMMMVGAFIGWKLALLTTFAGALAGSVFAAASILAGKRDANAEIPFGVFLGVGAMFSLFYGKMAIELWLGMAG